MSGFTLTLQPHRLQADVGGAYKCADGPAETLCAYLIIDSFRDSHSGNYRGACLILDDKRLTTCATFHETTAGNYRLLLLLLLPQLVQIYSIR